MPTIQSNKFTPSDNLTSQILSQISESEVVTGKQSSQAVRGLLAMESASVDVRDQLNDALGQFDIALESVANGLFADQKIELTTAQKKAASFAGLAAHDVRSFMTHEPRAMVAAENASLIDASGISDALERRSIALEAYDERENRNAIVYSIVYNMQSARQDEFGETLFPTITMTPEDAGVSITVNLLKVYDAIERQLSGAVSDFKKKNILRALADHTVLRKEQTRIIPVARQAAIDEGIFSTEVSTYNVDVEGEIIPTRPLRPGVEVDVLGVSAVDSLVATGVQNQTDTLDPTISLQGLYIKFGDDLVKFNVANLPTANFIAAPQGHYKQSNLNFTTKSILLTKASKQTDGSDLVDLSAVVSGDYLVRLEVEATGRANIEFGTVKVNGAGVRVDQIQNSDGEVIDLSDNSVTALVTALNDGVIVGYDILAYRTNANRRQQGQFIDVEKYTQQYVVPLRSPITVHHPAHAENTDSADVQALITATRIRTSNEAVTAVLRAISDMSDYIDARDVTGEGPEVLGVGRFFVRPQFMTYHFDAQNEVDGVRSFERAQDIQGALVNRIRDMAYRLYRDSEYKAASDALNGGVGPLPTVIIATDPVLARYINVTGDLRTLGGEFDVRIVSTLDKRFEGKIFVTFGVFSGDRNAAPNPLNFGNCFWAPELVLTANLSRQGTFSRETVVSPRYRFEVNLPVGGLIEVSNIPDVLNKMPIFVNDVTAVNP